MQGKNTGKKYTRSEEYNQKISKSKTGKERKIFTETAKKNMSDCKIGDKNANYRKTPSDATIQNMKNSAKLRKPKTCECGKTCSPSNYKRWHGDNCKSKIFVNTILLNSL